MCITQVAAGSRVWTSAVPFQMVRLKPQRPGPIWGAVSLGRKMGFKMPPTPLLSFLLIAGRVTVLSYWVVFFSLHRAFV